MLPYISKRLLLAIPTLFAVSFVTFFLGYLAPGSPVDILMGQRQDPELRKQLTTQYGLDQPPLVQYGRFLSGAVRGDLGMSFVEAGKPVTEKLKTQFPVTAILAITSILLAILIGVPAGVAAALRHNGFLDRGIMLVVLTCVSLPTFVIGPLMVLAFAIKNSWLPASGWDVPSGGFFPYIDFLVMPALVLAARPAALIARFMRSSMLDVVGQDYIRTARAKGLSPARVILKHALKNAFLPVLTVIGNSFGYLLTGSFVVETVFSIPGIGYESIASILQRDYPVIQGVALLVAAVFLAVNLLVDVLYGVIDPRVRFEGAK